MIYSVLTAAVPSAVLTCTLLASIAAVTSPVTPDTSALTEFVNVQVAKPMPTIAKIAISVIITILFFSFIKFPPLPFYL